jgi:hypothetical protein
MLNGANAAWAAGGNTLAIPSHGLTSGLAVVYTEAAGASISGLTTRTVYYVSRIDANTIGLAATQADALAGNLITLVNLPVPAVNAPDAYTLGPVGISGTPSFKWQVANSLTGAWTDTGSSVTMTTYYNPAISTLWNFGTVGYRYIRLNVVGPTAGGIYLVVTAVGSSAGAYVDKSGDIMTGTLYLNGATGNVVSQASVTANAFFGDLSGATLGASQVTFSKLASGAVDSTKIAADAVAGAQILAGSVSATKLASGVIDTTKLKGGTPDTGKGACIHQDGSLGRATGAVDGSGNVACGALQ